MANIMILTWLFPPSTGGIETNTYRLAKSLSCSHNVSVFTGGKSYPGEKNETFDIFRVKKMGEPRSLEFKDYPVLSKEMEGVLKDRKIDVVISHNLACLPTKFSKTLIRASEKCEVPLVEYCGDARYKNLNKALIGSFSEVLTVSNFVRKRMIEIGYDRKRVKTLHIGIPTELFDASKYSRIKSRKMFGLPANKKIVLFPSRAIRCNGEFNRQKGFLTIISSLRDIAARMGGDFIVVFPAVVGRKNKNRKANENLARLKLRLKKDGVEDNVFFIERRISADEMPFLYKAADIVLTPSVDEALGTVFLEALSMGVPAIGAKSGGIPEIIVKGKTGFLIKYGDSKGLAKKIVKLLSNDKLRKKMSVNSRKRAVKVFGYDKMIKKIEKIIRQVSK